MKKSSVSERMAMAEKRLGKDYGKGSGKKIAPKVKIKPTGNPLKGKVGVKATVKF